MTKQEEIREGIDMRAPIPQGINKVLLKLLGDYKTYLSTNPLNASSLSLDEYLAQAITDIMYGLKSKGCVIKVDRELPENPWSHKGIRTIRGRITDPTELQFCAYSLAKKDMADRVAVEELI